MRNINLAITFNRLLRGMLMLLPIKNVKRSLTLLETIV